MIASLQKLKQQELENYDILKTVATLYINLKNNNNLVCPQNELDYYIYDEENITNVIAELKEEAYANCYESFVDYLKYKLSEEKELILSLNNSQKYLEKAIINKTKTVEKWETNIEKIKNKLSNVRKTKPVLEYLYNNIKKDKVLFHSVIVKKKDKNKNTTQIGVCMTFSYKDETILFGNNNSNQYELYIINDTNKIPINYYMFYQ